MTWTSMSLPMQRLTGSSMHRNRRTKNHRRLPCRPHRKSQRIRCPPKSLPCSCKKASKHDQPRFPRYPTSIPKSWNACAMNSSACKPKRSGSNKTSALRELTTVVWKNRSDPPNKHRRKWSVFNARLTNSNHELPFLRAGQARYPVASFSIFVKLSEGKRTARRQGRQLVPRTRKS